MRMAKLENSDEFYHLLWESLHAGLPVQVSKTAPASEKDAYTGIIATAQMTKLQQMFAVQVTICKLLWYTDIDYEKVQGVLQVQLKTFMSDAFIEKNIALKRNTAATVFPRFFSSAQAFAPLKIEQRDLLYMSTMYFLTVSNFIF